MTRPDPWVVGTDYHRDPWEGEMILYTDDGKAWFGKDGIGVTLPIAPIQHNFGPILRDPGPHNAHWYVSECSCGLEVAGSSKGRVIRKQDQHLGVIGGDAA